jgi:hypothetical protein
MVLVACLCCLSPAYASLTRSQDRPHLQKEFGRDRGPEPAPKSSQGGLVITEDTEVKLDGQACKFEEVPKNAEIILLNLASDKKVILQIHFRTKK